MQRRDFIHTATAGLLALGAGPAALSLSACSRSSRVDSAAAQKLLLVGNGVEPKGLDPHIVTGVAEGKIIASLLEGLVRAHPSDDLQLRPGMAEQWSCDAAAKQWRFKLGKRRWSNGRELEAQDFLYAWQRMLAGEFAGSYAFLLFNLANAELYHNNHYAKALWLHLAESRQWCRRSQALEWADKINWSDATAGGLQQLAGTRLQQLLQQPQDFAWPQGFSPVWQQALLEAMLDWRSRQRSPEELWKLCKVGASAVNRHELLVELQHSDFNFPAKLLHHVWYPLCRECVEQHGSYLQRGNPWWKPGNIVVNGPFNLAEWKVNAGLRVTANQLYWDRANVALQAIEFVPVVNGFAETRMFAAGALHITNNVPAELLESSKSKHGQRLRFDKYFSNSFYRLNTAHAALRHVDFRRALSLAIDRDLLVNQVLHGAGEVLRGFTPPMQGYAVECSGGFDAGLARRLFENCRIPAKQLQGLSILISTREVQKSVAEAIQAMWQKHLGLHIDIQAREWTAFLQARERRDYSILASSWSGDFLDPASFVELLESTNGNNATGWSDAQFDRLLEQARRAASQKQRYELLAQAERLMLQAQPVIGLWTARRSYLLSAQVRGWHPLLLDNHPWDCLSLQPEQA